MFRGGGKVSSYGTGIASGLAKPKRGLVDEPGGYAGFSNLAQFLANQAAGTQTGGNILSQTVGKVQGPPLSPQMQAIENSQRQPDEPRAGPWPGRCVHVAPRALAESDLQRAPRARVALVSADLRPAVRHDRQRL